MEVFRSRKGLARLGWALHLADTYGFGPDPNMSVAEYNMVVQAMLRRGCRNAISDAILSGPYDSRWKH